MSTTLFNRGQDLFESGDYEASITIFNNLRDNGFELKDTHYLLAQNYLYKMLELKKKFSSSYADPIKKTEMQKEFQNSYEKAFENCKKSVELYNFKDSDSLFCLGEIQRLNGDLRSAILNYLRAEDIGDREASQRLMEIKMNEPNSMELISQVSNSVSSSNGKFVFQ